MKAVGILLLSAFWAACGAEARPSPWTLEELAPEQGLSVRIPEFEVPAGEEVQDCYFLRVPDLAGDGAPIWIREVKTAINPGSHHFNVFRVRTVVALDPEAGEPVTLGGIQGWVIRGNDPAAECWRSGNWADWPLLTNTQKSSPDDPYTTWALPPGVAFSLQPGETLMLQTHYVNATTQATPFMGRVGVNFHRFTGTTTPVELGTLFATQQSIRVCQSNPEVTYSGTCRFPLGRAVTVDALNGHFHSRGKRFDVFTWDGKSEQHPAAAARLYSSQSWDDPPMSTALNATIAEGGGVWWDCHYQWTLPAGACEAVNARDPQHGNDCCYTFGPTVETSEHCNLFLYYYPKVEDVFCN